MSKHDSSHTMRAFTWRGFLAASAVAGMLGALDYSRRSQAKTETPTEVEQHPAEQGSGTRPFRMSFAEADLIDLRRRINATRWPEREATADSSEGVQLATMQKVARYWGVDYDWRKCEAKLKAIPQFMTEIDGLAIHFHSRPFETRRRTSAQGDPRLARLDHRAAQNHRAAD